VKVEVALVLNIKIEKRRKKCKKADRLFESLGRSKCPERHGNKTDGQQLAMKE